jgi:hypothetical protein
MHSAGAIVSVASPFADLQVTVSEKPITREVAEAWVRPFYMLDIADVAAVEAAICPVARRIDERLVSELLSYLNWRPRVVAAEFAAIRDLRGSLDEIGRLLLRSDVCYAGRAYCLTLAAFNTKAASEYLSRYLEYYLTRPDLWFDQGDALAAVVCLDEANGTSVFERFEGAWARFAADKPQWDLDYSVKQFARRLQAVRKLAARWAG